MQTVIVLGCSVRGETPSLMLRYRLEAALEWMTMHPNSVAVLCGGQGEGEDISEAECMKRWLMQHGIDESRLKKEDTSTNTRENIRNAKKIVDDNTDDPTQAVVVSTGFHLFRSKRICESEGFSAYGIAAKMPELPFFHLNYYCREFASVLKMYLQEIIA
ncbi:MAG: YdcF family protein [Clostridia bacterium]|nr:YdcF family protein [Clostridia bacterium]